MRGRIKSSVLLPVCGFSVLSLFLLGGPASAADIDDPDRGWVYGNQVVGISCWTGPVNAVLQVKEGGVWKTVSSGRVSRSDKACPTDYPWRVRYKFTLATLGQSSGKYTTRLEVRELVDGKSFPFVKSVWPSRQDQIRSYEEAIKDLF
jgi:hypothetical protein